MMLLLAVLGCAGTDGGYLTPLEAPYEIPGLYEDVCPADGEITIPLGWSEVPVSVHVCTAPAYEVGADCRQVPWQIHSGAYVSECREGWIRSVRWVTAG